MYMVYKSPELLVKKNGKVLYFFNKELFSRLRPSYITQNA